MKSSIYLGKVWHKRLSPKEHEFTYPLFTFALDLSEKNQSSSLRPLFSWDSWGIFSIKSKDYLRHLSGTLKEKALSLLGDTHDIQRITFLTVPRYFGYVFNPVSFFVCYDASDIIRAVIIEVNNTFSESFVYLAELPNQTKNSFGPIRFEKKFYVSPFLEVDGEYMFHLRQLDASLHIQVDLYQANALILSTSLSGKIKQLSRRTLFSLILGFPLTAALTMTRIQVQALSLYFSKKIGVFRKPDSPVAGPHSSFPNLISRLRLWILSLANNAKNGN